jgi:protein-tyrosine-phosphatase
MISANVIIPAFSAPFPTGNPDRILDSQPKNPTPPLTPIRQSIIFPSAMPDHKHVLFVCTGNTCRSPMAEGLFAKLTTGRDDYSCSSAGVAAYGTSPVSADTRAVLQSRKAPVPESGGRGVTKSILEEVTHVFAMTQGHLDVLERAFPEYAGKFHLVCEFADVDGNGPGADVPDPIGMGRGAYEAVADVLESALPMVIAYIDQTTSKSNPD